MTISVAQKVARTSIAASVAAVALFGASTPASAAPNGSYQDTLAKLNKTFTTAEANTAWPKGMCTSVYTDIKNDSATLSTQTANRPNLVQLHTDAGILNESAKAMLNECATFDGPNRPAQLENRYLRVDMQLWAEQFKLDLDAPHNTANATKTRGKANVITTVADGKKKDLSTFRDCSDAICSTFTVIPKGTYMMGGTAKEQELINVQDYRRAWESPRHKVSINKRFAISNTEVTRGQFAQFVKETGYRVANGCVGFPPPPNSQSSDSSMWRAGNSWRNPGFAQTDNDPVVCISRPDAQAYATWLSKKTGQNYRLPSEAEWEYAARAGTTSPYFWGWDINDGCAYAAMYDQRSDKATGYGFKPKAECDDHAAYTNRVGSYKPNPWGLFDVTGNAREWTSDAWEPNLNSGPYTEAPRTGGVKQFPVLRGGGWDYMPQNERIAYRSSYYSNYIRSNMWGTRLVRELDDSQVGSGSTDAPGAPSAPVTKPSKPAAASKPATGPRVETDYVSRETNGAESAGLLGAGIVMAGATFALRRRRA